MDMDRNDKERDRDLERRERDERELDRKELNLEEQDREAGGGPDNSMENAEPGDKGNLQSETGPVRPSMGGE